MAFDTSVSGILAASSNLGIIGNNIANGSTVGFKSSTGEFQGYLFAKFIRFIDWPRSRFNLNKTGFFTR